MGCCFHIPNTSLVVAAVRPTCAEFPLLAFSSRAAERDVSPAALSRVVQWAAVQVTLEKQ